MKKALFINIILVIFTIQLKAQRKDHFPLYAGKYYFPISADRKGIDTFRAEWYSRELKDMKEPIIFKNKSKNEIYRFTWLRSFNHPITIRIEKNNNTYSIYWKEGNHDTDHPKLIIDKHKTIDKTAWDGFIAYLKRIFFWKLDTELTDINGNDGSQWILEGKLANTYHVVDRWTPNASTPYYKCCDYLLKLTDIKIDPKRKY